jgi:hypothetical protein
MEVTPNQIIKMEQAVRRNNELERDERNKVVDKIIEFSKENEEDMLLETEELDIIVNSLKKDGKKELSEELAEELD